MIIRTKCWERCFYFASTGLHTFEQCSYRGAHLTQGKNTIIKEHNHQIQGPDVLKPINQLRLVSEMYQQADHSF